MGTHICRTDVAKCWRNDKTFLKSQVARDDWIIQQWLAKTVSWWMVTFLVALCEQPDWTGKLWVETYISKNKRHADFYWHNSQSTLPCTFFSQAIFRSFQCGTSMLANELKTAFNTARLSCSAYTSFVFKDYIWSATPARLGCDIIFSHFHWICVNTFFSSSV